MRKLSFILIFLLSFIFLFSQAYALYPCINVTSYLDPSEAYPNSKITVYGDAIYDTDYSAGTPVAGAFVTVTIENQTGDWTTHTNSSGYFELKIVAPDSTGYYTVVTFITDYTCYGVDENTLTVVSTTTSTVIPTTTTIPISCSGNVNLTLSPNPVEISSTVNVEMGGTDCGSYVFAKGSCYGVNPCPGMACGGPEGGEITCSCQFTSPDTVDYHTYYACLDKNGDDDYNDPGESDSETLTTFNRTCTDSDGGKDYYTKGEVAVCTFYPHTGGCGGSVDTCDGNTLIEGYCDGNEGKSVRYACPYGCKDGACKSGGGCPTLFVYDGKEFVEIESLDIHAPEGIDTTYTTTFEMKSFDGKILLTEASYLLWEGSHIDSVSLINEKGKECQLISAIHSEDGNVLSKLVKSDDIRIETKPTEEILLTFESCSGNKFTFTTEGYNRSPKAIKLALNYATITGILFAVIVVVILVYGGFKYFAKK